MKDIRHSVQLDIDRCHGCTNCIKTCPTQAIRVRNGKAKIIKDKCIDCGECIRVCPYHAKKAIIDSFDSLKNYKYTVALPAPTFYGQFPDVSNVNVILNALLGIGFDDVFEVATAAQIITKESKKIISQKNIEKPIINSACPAVVKLIATRFPGLIDNILPVISPMQLAGRLAREEAMAKTGLKAEEIGIFFISPCPAKATCTQYPIGLENSNVDGAISIKDIYLKMIPHLKKKDNLKNLSKASLKGICWANSGGEASAGDMENYIAVDGIHNVLKMLEAIENNSIKDVDFVELLACTGGCVGGPLNVENGFITNRRIKKLAKSIGDNPNDISYKYNECDISWEIPVHSAGKLHLDDDIAVAMQKLERIEQIYSTLPKLDCGSCGSPTCRAHAEDIVMGYTNENACIVRFKEKVLELASGMLNLEIGSDKNEDF